MWQRLVTLILAAFLLASAPQAGRAAPRSQAGVSWAFDTRTDKELTPHTRVFLCVGGRRIPIGPAVTAQFNPITRQQYKERQIPAAAVAACSGWWAGQGEDFYVVRRHGHWEVFERGLDEEAPIPAYRRVKSIPTR